MRRNRLVYALGTVVATSLLLGLDCGQATSDADSDGIPDAYDNCRQVANPSQRNSVRGATEKCVGAIPQPDSGGVIYGSCANDPTASCLSALDCTAGDACDCDLDGSGHCNISDFNLFLDDYLSGVPSGNGSDLTEDGVVDAADFARFEPRFAQGSGGPGSALVEVVDAGPEPGACYDEKWARRMWASEGRVPSPNNIMDCSVGDDPASQFPIPQAVYDIFPVAQVMLDAMAADKNNPSDALARHEAGLDIPICPNAAFSISSKIAPRACDAHDLCLDHCGTKVDDCNRQFYRDLFNTCSALEGYERAFCHASCTIYATLYATAVASSQGSFTPIFSPPADDDADPPTDGDLAGDLYNCQCRPAVCEKDSDCLTQSITPRGVVCDRGYCVQDYEGFACTEDDECPDGYRCDVASGDCWFDVRGLPSLVGAPPPVCGDAVCQEGIESCQASACPEDCGDVGAPLVANEGRCGLDDACLLDRDCAEGACLHGSCQSLADGSVCSNPNECASDSCDFLTRHCKSGCLVDQDCGTGICSLFQCSGPLPNGSLCDANSDCATGNCFAGICAPVCGDDRCELPELCGAVDSGLECNADCGKCGNGTPCLTNAVCGSGVCNGGFCAGAGSVGPGGLCTTNGACSSGSCVAGFCAGSCGDGVCTVVPNAESCFASSCQADCGKCGNGLPCTLNADCSSGRCFGLVCAPQGPFCGDLSCNGGETCSSCGFDCGICPFCGDLSCNNNETCASCVIDCGVCAFCGDLSCNNNETCSSCAFDCGDCCAPVGHICAFGSDCCSNNCSFFTCRP